MAAFLEADGVSNLDFLGLFKKKSPSGFAAPKIPKGAF